MQQQKDETIQAMKKKTLDIAMPDFFSQIVETWINEGGLPKECKVIS